MVYILNLLPTIFDLSANTVHHIPL